MLLRLRVSLPDRPGALGRITRTLGAVGADILQMTVLEREGGRALDEFTVAWSGSTSDDRLTAGLETIQGVRVEAIWSAAEPPGAFPDLDVLGHVAANPGRAVITLADAMPGIFSADWSAVVRADATREIVHASWSAPSPMDPPPFVPQRPRSFTAGDGVHFAATPLAETGLVLLLARSIGPEFHRAEVSRLTLITEVAMATAAGQLPEPQAALQD
jgi:ACT domain-containing protein